MHTPSSQGQLLPEKDRVLRAMCLTTKKEHCHDWRTAVGHRTVSSAEIQAEVGNTVAQKLLQIGYFKDSSVLDAL
ncbi:hypothetical protein TNCV_2498521 [Trichonephila clavipes]|nr:hypothetical protein TNCV_2498521 [Trichonephila clavipes]